jgi:hypothetical protein
MKTHTQRLPIIVSVLAICVFLTSCGGNGNNNTSSLTVSVTQSGTTSTMSAGNSPVTITASVTNDKSNAGVTWSLSPSSGCGVLAPSGAGATYTPPLESALNADCNATVTATSVTNSAKNATMAFTLKAIEINLPVGEQTTQSTTASGSNLTLSASIADDASGTATLNWSLTDRLRPLRHIFLKLAFNVQGRCRRW